MLEFQGLTLQSVFDADGIRTSVSTQLISRSAQPRSRQCDRGVVDPLASA